MTMPTVDVGRRVLAWGVKNLALTEKLHCAGFVPGVGIQDSGRRPTHALPVASATGKGDVALRAETRKQNLPKPILH